MQSLSSHWWLLALRGVASILFAIIAFLWPGITVISLALVWGAFALVDGAFALWAAIAGKAGAQTPRWWLAIVGLAGIVAGILAFLVPAVTAFVLMLFIAAWAIVIGIMQIVGAIRLRKEIEGEFWLALTGLLSILFGLALVAVPGIGLVTLVWMLAIFAALAGISQIALALRLKRLQDG